MKSSISRRAFLKRSMVATGLTIAASVSPLGYRMLNASQGEKDLPIRFKPNVWLEVTPDNRITITVAQTEMGQGIHTALAMIVADELEAEWGQTQVKQAPAGDAFKNPILQRQITATSISVRSYYEPLRKAGAAGRAMLVKAASLTWQVSEEECEARLGKVRCKKDGRSLTYGELCQKAAQLSMPQNPPLKREAEFRFIGTSMPRLDIPDKVEGVPVFSIDFSVPDMHYAVLARPPVYGAKPILYDQKSGENIKGVRKIIPTPRGIAVCAETLEAARKGRDALNVNWDQGAQPNLSNDSVEKSYWEHLDKPGLIARKDGDARQALRQAAKKLEATYFTSHLAHAPMEPMNCTASVTKERCDVWAPTQFQTLAHVTAVKVSGLPPDKVHIHTLMTGGAFGRRNYWDFVEEAVLLSKELGKPVKVLWAREEDMKNDFYRPATLQKIEAGIDSQGKLLAWSQKVVAPSIAKIVNPGLIKDGIDQYLIWGINDTAYSFPNLHVEVVTMDSPIPVGVWRSVQNGPNAFVIESFLDELAYAAGRDPLEFRLELLQNNIRSRRVLETVAEKVGWGKPMPKGQGRGIAHHSCFGSHIAHVAEISVNETTGKISVHRIVAAIDCGQVVNPGPLKAQIEGGIILALSSSLKEKVIFADGGVKSANYDDYEIMRISEVPEIEVYILKSQDKPGGAGELGVPPTAPAVGNAFFNATGVRLRCLPMNPVSVLEALKKKGA